MHQLSKNEQVFAISMLFLENTVTNPENSGLSSRSLDIYETICVHFVQKVCNGFFDF